MQTDSARFIGILRHRIGVDGEGVTTLAAFHGCPLRCRHCLNPQSFDDRYTGRMFTPESLYDEVKIDELYFVATNGGVAFGGGEPACHPGFIRHFRELCGPEWRITLESSLNVPEDNIEALIDVVDFWIIDVKDMDPDIYTRYTRRDNSLTMANLRRLAAAGLQDRCMVRIPLIPGHNTEADREASKAALMELGYTNFDLFTYLIRKHE